MLRILSTHDSVFGGHMGEKKTRERIRLSFYWPGLRQSIHDYVSSCTSFQLRLRPVTLGRAPEDGNKLRNRWQGPAIVVKVKPPHSYLVDMGTAVYVKCMPIRYANSWHVFKDVESLLKKIPSLVVF